MSTAARGADALFAGDDAALRKPDQVYGFGFGEPAGARRRLAGRASGDFWAVLERLGVQLLVTREYEHLLVSLRVVEGAPEVSYLPLPHPTGIAVDASRQRVVVAATRNPNQLFTLRRALSGSIGPCWLPRSSWIVPGSLYLHDLAMVGGRLHANAVGKDVVVRFDDDGRFERVWWPKCVEKAGRPAGGGNHLQLNSIAAAESLEDSYLSASCAVPGRYRPGHHRFAVDGRGVIFSGRTREVVATGLTRPHSARLDGPKLWVDNSGYGEVGVVESDVFTPVRRLDGWTRGLALSGDVAFVGTSRVLSRFAHYAPGVGRARCAIEAIDKRSGATLGSLAWPYGNQIFAIEVVPPALSAALPYSAQGSRGELRRVHDAFFDDHEDER